MSVRRRGLTVAAILWAIAFGAPHLWWALGVPFGFPGGAAGHARWMASDWRVAYNIAVVVAAGLAAGVASILGVPRERIGARPRALSIVAAWAAAMLLGIRGVAGVVADGSNDLVWSPAFLLGGVLFGALAYGATRRR